GLANTVAQNGLEGGDDIIVVWKPIFVIYGSISHNAKVFYPFRFCGSIKIHISHKIPNSANILFSGTELFINLVSSYYFYIQSIQIFMMCCQTQRGLN